MTAAQCSVPIQTLKDAPYSQPWGAYIYAKVSATNLVGTSEYSTVGNGAQILTLPDAPVSLADVEAVTNKDQIGISWNEGAANGGTVVIDYKVWYAEQGNAFTVLTENVVPTEYTALALTTGVWYQFKV